MTNDDPDTDEDFDRFLLPVPALAFYDDPYRGAGDEGYDMARLRAEVEADGGIRNPLAVGKSATDVRERDDHQARAYDGNHRLAVAKELGLVEILCEHAWADDAVPLTRAEIEALGGRVLDVPPNPPAP